MLNERYSWHVCFDDGDVWDCISSHETRAEAEAELRRARPSVPDAFLVRVTFTRMDRARATTTLAAV